MNEQNPTDGHAALKEKLKAQKSHIKGWGIDADPRNDPTYPMRRRLSGDRSHLAWERPVQQADYEEVLHSNERPDVTRVFGTSAPASGVSGALRRCAFHFSEGRFSHWLLLLAADRVDVMAGFADDLVHGRGTQCFSDKGMKAKWEHDRQAVITKAAVGVAVVGVLALICFRRHLMPPPKRSLSAKIASECRQFWRARH